MPSESDLGLPASARRPSPPGDVQSSTRHKKPNVEAVHAGMGAIVLEKGVAFRVWAPNAKEVRVAGEFNHFRPLRADAMQKEEGGTWYTYIPDASVGQRYQYLIKTDTGWVARVDPRARLVTNSVGESVIWKAPKAQASKFKAPALNEAIIYELHVGSFHVREGESVGTFDSAIEKLDYLRELGVNVVEVMPIAEFAGDVSWGYNPAHPFAVESAYGGPDALRRFIDAAHEREIAVVIDVVYNHFGPSDLGLWQFDGWSENNLGGIYFYNDWRATTPWGETRPDYGRGEVRSYIRDNALMWLVDFGADGLRWDMTLFVRTFGGKPGEPADDLKDGWGLLQWVNGEIAAAHPGALTIAEDLQDSEWLVKPTGEGGAGFGCQWDSAFVHPVRDAIIAASDEWRDIEQVLRAVQNCYAGDAFRRVIYTESHDEVANGKARVPQEISPSDPGGLFARKRSMLGSGLVLTSPGVPMLFQGQEFLEDMWFRDNVPLDWSKVERFGGVLRFYRELIALRRNLAGNTAGLTGQGVALLNVDRERHVLAFHRFRDRGPGDDVIVIVNLSNCVIENYAVGVPAEGLWELRLNSCSKTYCSDFEDLPGFDGTSRFDARDGHANSLSLTLPAYAVLVLSQQRPSET